MYKESYISDGPEGVTKYDHVLGAEYRIENGRRVYTRDHHTREVPAEKNTLIALVIGFMSIVAACFLAAGITVIYLIIKSIYHV
jgi:hypothetical protein